MMRLITMVNRTLALATILLSMALVVCVTWQVVSRYVLGTPSTVTDEMARFLFIWIGLIGGAYTFGQKRHLAIDLLTMRLTGPRKVASELFIQMTVALFAAVVMVYGGMNLVIKTLESTQISPALGMPMGWIYLAVPLSGGLILFYCAVFSIQSIGSLNRSKKHVASVYEPANR